mmetsp:Transcript_36712/g.56382  ORF Transcript_36712/g.56382 Transcript_36712/m.56382 type:complete len:110 (-) Transcript_36712:130-459(-)
MEDASILDGEEEFYEKPKSPNLFQKCKSCCMHSFCGLKSPSDRETYYVDEFNDFAWQCSFGTREEDGIWMNRNDQPGTIMSFMVWLLISTFNSNKENPIKKLAWSFACI